MSPEAQRLALAKLEGWKPCEPRVFVRFAPSHAFMKDGAYYGGLSAIPRYLEDLNAIHEVEKIKKLNWPSYIDNLVAVTESHLTAHLVMATAPQRAEAILKTLNLWTND
jgi:hypothetical protein